MKTKLNEYLILINSDNGVLVNRTVYAKTFAGAYSETKDNLSLSKKFHPSAYISEIKFTGNQR